MKAVLSVLFSFLVAGPAFGQTPVTLRPATESTRTFTESASGPCWRVDPGVGYHTIRWTEIGTVSAGTVKLQGSNASNCSSPTDIIAAQAATSSGAVVATAGVYQYVQIVTESQAGTGQLAVWYGGYKDIISASVSVGDVTNAGTFAVQCTSGCTGGTSDDDDGTIAAGQTSGIGLSETMVFDGTNWKRLTIGTAGTASTQVLTIQGIASGTAVPISGSVTASGTVTITDGAGALNTIVDSGTITTVSAVTAITNALPAGTNAIGKLAANSGVDIGDVDVTSIIPGTGATNLGKAIDTATGATDTGVLLLATRDDALTTLTPIDGDNTQLRVGSTGALHVAPIAGTNLIGKVGIDQTTPGTTNAVTVVDTGGNPLAVTDPCDGNDKVSVPFSISSATTTELANALADNKLYACGFDITVGGANNVALVEDDTDACASPTAGMAGGVTAATGWNFAANGGMTKGNGGSTIFKTAAVNRYVCLMTSTTAQTSGSFQYVLAP